MIKQKKVNILILLMGLIFVLQGCGGNNIASVLPEAETSKPATDKYKPMLEEAEYLYERTEMLPGIMVDLIGYDPQENKVAVLEGTILPAEFEIVDNSTNEAVFKGKVEKQSENGINGRSYGIADFSSLQKEGSFYVKADLLGRSKDFEIKSGIYEMLIDKAFAGLGSLKKDDSKSETIVLEDNPEKSIEVSGGLVTNSLRERDVTEGCLAVFDFLKIYEYYPNIFKDSELIPIVKYEVKWLMKMQNPETGGVYASISRKADSGNYVVVGETTRATAYFTAAMAKCSYMFVKTDPALSKECLRCAVSGWTCLEANKELVGASQKYRAATELYRATGAEEYKNAIETYLSVNVNKAFEERIEIDGAMTYMSTPRAVNRSYCTLLMQHFMGMTEDIAASSKNARYMIKPGCENDSDVLKNLAELIEADFILTSREYGDIELNYLHYLCGRNPESSIHKELSENPDAYAQFLLLMGRMLTDNSIR